MSSIQAPAWAFTAQAIDGTGDTHLPKGVHVRALPSPRLGMPAAPFAVYRSRMTLDQARAESRTDGVIWIDSFGATVTAPFTVQPNNPVTGYFPVPNVFFAEITTSVQSAPPVATVLTGPAIPSIPARLPLPTIPPVLQVPPVLQIPPVLQTPPQAAQPHLLFEVLANSPNGPAPLLARDQPPFAVAHWTIPMVRVSGQGAVREIRWLDETRSKENQRLVFWELWSLPVKPAPRYAPTATAPQDAKDRIGRAGVVRQPLYIANTVASPAAAPAATPSDAMKRVDQIRPEIDRWLDILLHDLSKPAAELTDNQTINGKNGSITVPILPFLLAGAVDPDAAHYMGFGDVDIGTDVPPGSLAFYRIRGLWDWNPKLWRSFELSAFSGATRADVDAAVKEFPELKQFDIVPKEKGPFVDLYATAVTIVGFPPMAPAAPSIDALIDRGWQAEPPPPNVRRGLQVQGGGFVPHALAALTATDLHGLRTLNPYPKIGKLLPGKAPPAGLTPQSIIVSLPGDVTAPGKGHFEDQDASAGPVVYRLAQGDWFGRWSPFTSATAPDKARTPPMRPTLEVFTQPPVIMPPTPVPTGPLPGSIEVRIPVPRAPDLPAGGSLLARLDLDETFDGAALTTTHYSLGALPATAVFEPHPSPGHDLLIVHRPGPSLLPATSRKVTYQARWIDTLNLVSANSDPAIRTMTDPRPPPPPAVITELRYTARPDAQGHARVDLDFNSVAGTRYRVYFSTETALLAALDGGDAAAHAAAADIRGAIPGAPRAMKFRDHKAAFGWDHFESLTKQSIVATGPVTHFTHRVSGSLDVLAIYRVLSEGPSGSLSEMTEADLVPFGVPNLGGPSTPQLSILNAGLDPTTQGVRLHAKVPIGKAAPIAWRLRRASVPVSDPLSMNIVAHGTVGSVTTDPESIGFDIDATDPLHAWRQYRFSVEVQAGPPAGAPTVGVLLPGEWSAASSPAALTVIPPAPPADPSALVIANAGATLTITLTHPAPDTLFATAVGPYRFETWRVEPGKRPIPLMLAYSRGAGATWTATDTNSAAPSGTYVTVRVIDPIGRPSNAVVSNEVP